MESTTGYTFTPCVGSFTSPWHRHQIEGTNVFYCLIRKTERFTISNVESQVFTPNNSRLDPGSNPGCPRDKRMSCHWTNCACLYKITLIVSACMSKESHFSIDNLAKEFTSCLKFIQYDLVCHFLRSSNNCNIMMLNIVRSMHLYQSCGPTMI